MKFGLTDIIIAGIEQVFESDSKIDKAYIFGSRAKGNFKDGSDIDIAIKGTNLTFKEILHCTGKLEELNLPYKIDLLDYDKIKEPALKEHIDRVGIEFYSRWKDCKLGDIAEIISSKRIYFSDYVTIGIPFYRSKEIIEKALGDDISTDLFITFEKFDEIKKKHGAPVNGDILISAVGERAGIPYCVNNDGDFYFKDGNLIWFRNFNSAISSSFLVYYFNSSIGQQRLESTMIGSAQKALTIIGLKNLDVAFPPFAEQTAIASILSSLDDKVELLRRQNKTLEQLAETLFRQWFVEEAEESWKFKKISDIIEVRDGTHDSPRQTETGRYLVTSKHLKPTGIDFSTAYKISENDFIEVNKRSKVDKDDILFSMIGTLGLIHYVDKEPDFAIKNIGLFKSSQKPSFARFLFLLLISPEGKRFVYENADGSTQEYISLGSLRNFEFKYPGDRRIEEFDLEVKPIFQKMESNTIQIRTLTQTRDTLLPKLMRGEVRVNL